MTASPDLGYFCAGGCALHSGYWYSCTARLLLTANFELPPNLKLLSRLGFKFVEPISSLKPLTSSLQPPISIEKPTVEHAK